MSEKIKLLLINGTSRPNNRSILVSNYIKDLLDKDKRFNINLVSPEDFDLKYDGNGEGLSDERYSKLVKESDCFLIVVPEYNHSFPGSLKRLLDSEFISSYSRKAVGLVGVSAGLIGGARALESLIPVLRELGLYVTSNEVLVQNSYEAFDDKGKYTQDEGKLDERLKKLLDELFWLGTALKSHRV